MLVRLNYVRVPPAEQYHWGPHHRALENARRDLSHVNEPLARRDDRQKFLIRRRRALGFRHPAVLPLDRAVEIEDVRSGFASEHGATGAHEVQPGGAVDAARLIHGDVVRDPAQLAHLLHASADLELFKGKAPEAAPEIPAPVAEDDGA